MRDIKFRAWSVATNSMLNNCGYHPYICEWHNEDYQLHEEGAYTISPKFNNYVLMQYTGLKDKFGKEIYEGDIVKQFGNPKPFHVEFFNSAWRADRIYILDIEIKTAAIEVIGNIYQNPSLL